MIKKIGCFSFLSLLFCTPVQSADWGFEVGADLWRTDMTGLVDLRLDDGGYLNIDLNKDVNMDRANNQRFYFTFYHPIPFLPNVLIAANRIEHKGSGNPNIADVIYLPGQNFDGANTAHVNGFLNIDHYDVTGFWTPLDIELISVDLGLTYRKFDGRMYFNVDVLSTPFTSDFDNEYILAYMKTTAYLPLTGLSASFQVNYGYNFDTKNGEQAIDTDVAIQYRNWTGLGVGIGYRYFDVDLESNLQGRKLTYKLDTFGPYLSLSYRF